MRTLSLTSDESAALTWTLTAAGPVPTEHDDLAEQQFAATVPGEVHTDLLAAGAIPEPFDGDNETALQWIGRTDWGYRLRFDFDRGDEQRHDLVAEGLDTFATVVLNGIELGRTANQHRSYRFDISEVVVTGSNELVITFAAPAVAAEQAEQQLGALPVSYSHPYNAIRKMASSYGWDWGPDLAGAGIWKPIKIESWSTARLAAVRPLATVSDGTGVLQAEVDLEWARTGTADAVTVSVEVGGQLVEATAAPGVDHVTLRAEIPAAELWWPRGYGEQALYPTAVRLRRDDTVLDRWDGRVGFRNLAMQLTPDRDGTAVPAVLPDEFRSLASYGFDLPSYLMHQEVRS